MSTEPINYEAVIADLEAKKAQIDATINMLRAFSGISTSGVMPPPGGPGGGAAPDAGSKIAPDAFFGKSIPDATVTHLRNVRKKLSTQAIIDALVTGGLPASKYNTVYAILRRRENQVGDIINMQGEWGLAAWYPNHTKAKVASKKSAVSESSSDDETETQPENADALPAEDKATA